MGTRSTTVFIQRDNNEKTGKDILKKICKFYKQYDGYPSGLGVQLAEFISTGELVNGFGLEETRIFNGIGCMAAQVIKELKEGAGNVYMVPVTDGKEEYNYEIIVNSPWYKGDFAPVTINMYDYKKLLFKGTPKEFLAKYVEVEDEVSTT